MLKPEILWQKGRALRLRSESNAEAVAVLEQALGTKRDYVPAYIKLAELWFELGKQQQALDTLEAGLVYAPNSRALKRRLAEFEAGGQDAPTPESSSASM